MGISRRIVGKDNKHPKRTPQKKAKEANLVETSSGSGLGSGMVDEVFSTYDVSRQHQD